MWLFSSRHFRETKETNVISGLLIFCGKKKQNFAGFSGANSRKNRPISWDFHGRKVKIRRKIDQFHEIVGEKKSNFQGFSAGTNS